MVRRWVRERRSDPFYRKAKREGYRSRAAYKLLQMHERYGVFRPGDVVVDLGAAPGGWSQVAVELSSPGRVVGIDLQEIEPLSGAELVRGDFTRPETTQRIRDMIGQASVVVSDMSPNISGNYSTDHARSIHLCEQALAFATQVLKPGGVFVVKVFEGDLFADFLVQARRHFAMVKAHHPEASRSSSSEVYVVAKGFKGRSDEPPAGDRPTAHPS
ncbi:MAG TPA: RlmE family RNA methyltransferase [Candidatus Thermoplasmatota archaeon]|nr:RlmE family RNA methyltransferase [Candidatus Thermoplasmatota archaeon]